MIPSLRRSEQDWLPRSTTSSQTFDCHRVGGFRPPTGPAKWGGSSTHDNGVTIGVELRSGSNANCENTSRFSKLAAGFSYRWPRRWGPSLTPWKRAFFLPSSPRAGGGGPPEGGQGRGGVEA